MAPFVAKLRDVGAALAPREEAEPYALVSGRSAERSQIDLAIECIGCGMCVSACTMVGRAPPSFGDRRSENARVRSFMSQ